MQNPFPAYATVSVGGSDSSIIAKWPNIPRLPFDKLSAEYARYLAEYSPRREGRALALWGAVGSGKTHTLVHALPLTRDAPLGVRPPQPLIAYVRVKGGDPRDFFSALMSQFSRADLKRLVLRAFNSYANMDDVDAAVPPDPPKDSRWEDAEAFFEAAWSGSVSWSETVTRQERDFELVQAEVDNFERAFRGLLTDELAGTAYRWIVGDRLSGVERRQIGVRDNIEGIERIQVAIRLVMALARRAGIPLLIVCDEVHTMLAADREGSRAGSEALLRCLVEYAVAEGAFLVMAMRDDAWVDLSSELRHRFSTFAIEVPPFSVEDARRLVAVHLGHDATDGTVGEVALDPFTAAAVEVLAAAAGGNPRQFLELAHLAMQRGIDQGERVIDDRLARAALEERPQDLPTMADIESAVRRACGTRSWAVEPLRVQDGVDLAVDREPGVPPLLVRIREGRTGSQEGRAAQDLVSGIDPAERIVLLVFRGFASEELLGHLREVGWSVLVARSRADFPAELDALFREVSEWDGSGVFEAGPVLKARLDALLAQLGHITVERAEAEDRLERRLTETLRSQTRSAAKAEWSSLHREWIGERTRLEAEARAAAAARETRTVREFVTATERAERLNQVLVRAASSALAVASVVAAAWLLMRLFPAVPGELLQFAASAVLVLGLVLTSPVWARSGSRGSLPGQKEVDLLAWVRNAGRSGAGRSKRSPRRRAFHAMTEPLPDVGFEGRLRAEPLPLIQRLLVQNRPREHEYALALQILQAEGISLEAKSVVLERWNLTPPPGTSDDGGGGLSNGHRPSDTLSALEAYYGFGTASRSMLEAFLRQISRHTTAAVAEDSPWPMAELARAYATGHDRDFATLLEAASEAQIRAAVNVLSPPSGNGLVTFYWLEDAQSDFLSCYLFLRKTLFFKERGQGILQLVLNESVKE